MIAALLIAAALTGRAADLPPVNTNMTGEVITNCLQGFRVTSEDNGKTWQGTIHALGWEPCSPAAIVILDPAPQRGLVYHAVIGAPFDGSSWLVPQSPRWLIEPQAHRGG